MAPAAVVERAAARGVRVLALTDHDDIGGLDEAREAATRCGVELIDGVEVSVTWRGHTLHVVGLRVDPLHPVLVSGLDANRSGRDGRARLIAERLRVAGVPEAFEGASTYVTNPELVSRAHFARFLVESRRVSSTQAAFDRYLGEGKPGYVAHEWASLGEALGWIVAAGGLPVLAHPGRYRLDEAGRRDLLEAFQTQGGAGVEVVTGSHSPDEYGYWARRAREYRLLSSTGSDFHGPRESYRDLGELPPLPAGCTPVWSAF